jgi:hypothetical protein
MADVRDQIGWWAGGAFYLLAFFMVFVALVTQQGVLLIGETAKIMSNSGIRELIRSCPDAASQGSKSSVEACQLS